MSRLWCIPVSHLVWRLTRY